MNLALSNHNQSKKQACDWSIQILKENNSQSEYKIIFKEPDWFQLLT